MPTFTRREKAIIDRYRTPMQVQRFINTFEYNHDRPDTMMGFRSVVRTGRAHCLEAVLTCATILEQHGYPPLILDLESRDNLDHVLYLFRDRRTGLWGTVGRSRDPGLHGRRPVFRNLRDLTFSYFDPFIDDTGRITAYGMGDLRDLDPYDWRFSEKNLWKVERYCIELPHTKLRSSDARYRKWYKIFRAFKKEHPDRRPVHFDNRDTWMPGYPVGR